MLTTMQIEAARKLAETKDTNDIVREFTAKVEADLARDIELWTAEGEPEMIESAKQDAEDLKYAISLIAEGNPDGAHEYICSRDTIIRESVPHYIWAWLSGSFLGE